jgi:cysteine dioxygenase
MYCKCIEIQLGLNLGLLNAQICLLFAQPAGKLAVWKTMMLIKARLSLEEFILEMSCLPAASDLAQLQERVDQLQLKDQCLRPYISFSDQAYSRRLVHRTPQFELLLLCWQPGQFSPIHDHSDSLNVTRVCQGGLTSREFVRTAEGVKQSKSVELEPNAVVAVDRHAIHQLANTSDAPLVTFHVYARPLQDIQVYCPRSGLVETVTVGSPAADHRG